MSTAFMSFVPCFVLLTTYVPCLSCPVLPSVVFLPSAPPCFPCSLLRFCLAGFFPPSHVLFLLAPFPLLSPFSALATCPFSPSRIPFLLLLSRSSFSYPVPPSLVPFPLLLSLSPFLLSLWSPVQKALSRQTKQVHQVNEVEDDVQTSAPPSEEGLRQVNAAGIYKNEIYT